MFVRFAQALALALAISLISADVAEAASRRRWLWGRNSDGGRAFAPSVELGLRLMTHYNRQETILTAPETFLAELQVNYFYKNIAGVYALAGISVFKARTTTFGGGIKVPFIALAGKRGKLVSGLALSLLADVAYYSTEEPAEGKIYDPTQVIVRYGGSMVVGLGEMGIYLNLTMMFTRVSDNFFIAPYVGVGFQF